MNNNNNNKSFYYDPYSGNNPVLLLITNYIQIANEFDTLSAEEILKFRDKLRNIGVELRWIIISGTLEPFMDKPLSKINQILYDINQCPDDAIVELAFSKNGGGVYSQHFMFQDYDSVKELTRGDDKISTIKQVLDFYKKMGKDIYSYCYAGGGLGDVDVFKYISDIKKKAKGENITCQPFSMAPSNAFIELREGANYVSKVKTNVAGVVECLFAWLNEERTRLKNKFQTEDLGNTTRERELKKEENSMQPINSLTDREEYIFEILRDSVVAVNGKEVPLYCDISNIEESILFKLLMIYNNDNKINTIKCTYLEGYIYQVVIAVSLTVEQYKYICSALYDFEKGEGTEIFQEEFSEEIFKKSLGLYVCGIPHCIYINESTGRYAIKLPFTRFPESYFSPGIYQQLCRPCIELECPSSACTENDDLPF